MIDLRYSSLKFPMPEAVRRNLERSAGDAGSYPDQTYERLKGLLAQDAGVGPENVVVGNGLDDVIDQLSRILEGSFIIPTPAFSEFARACKRNKKNFELAPCLKNNQMDLGPILSRGARLKGTIVWISNPNNPTGSVYDDRQIGELLENGAQVILDEAYFEFAPNQNSDRWKNEANLFRLRTFSKALGLPGVRLGYAITANRDILKRFESQRPFFPVNCMGLAAAGCLPILRKNMREKITDIKDTREMFANRVVKAGYTVVPSVANFVLVDFETREKTEKMLKRMEEIGFLLLPPWDEEFTGLPDNYVRFVIGKREDMEKIAGLLEEK